MRTTPLSLLLLVPLLAGCSHWGESNYLGFEFPQMSDLLAEFHSGDQLLLGTRLCPSISERRVSTDVVEYMAEEDRDELRACFDEAVQGPATLDADGCLAFTGVGEVSWELTPGDCGEQPELMRFTLIDPGPDLLLGLDEWRLRVLQEPAFDAELIGLAPGRSATELSEPSSAPRHVFEGEIEALVMRLDNANGRVWWMAPDVEFEFIGAGLEAVESGAGSLEPYSNGGTLPLRMSPGSSGHVRATLPGGQIVESPELIAVSLEDAVSLDLVAAEGYLFADVRDADGNLLHAAPIEWSVDEGSLAVQPGTLDTDNALLTGEYASYWDGNCEEAPSSEPEVRHAVVRARLGELEDTVTIEYTVEPASDFELGPDASCLYAEAPPTTEPEGCACTTDDNAPIAPLFISLGLLALLSSRRDRSRRTLGHRLDPARRHVGVCRR